MTRHSGYPHTPARTTTGEVYTPNPGSNGAWSTRCARCSHPISGASKRRDKLWGHICADAAACADRRRQSKGGGA